MASDVDRLLDDLLDSDDEEVRDRITLPGSSREMSLCMEHCTGAPWNSTPPLPSQVPAQLAGGARPSATPIVRLSSAGPSLLGNSARANGHEPTDPGERKAEPAPQLADHTPGPISNRDVPSPVRASAADAVPGGRAPIPSPDDVSHSGADGPSQDTGAHPSSHAESLRDRPREDSPSTLSLVGHARSEGNLTRLSSLEISHGASVNGDTSHGGLAILERQAFPTDVPATKAPPPNRASRVDAGTASDEYQTEHRDITEDRGATYHELGGSSLSDGEVSACLDAVDPSTTGSTESGTASAAAREDHTVGASRSGSIMEPSSLDVARSLEARLADISGEDIDATEGGPLDQGTRDELLLSSLDAKVRGMRAFEAEVPSFMPAYGAWWPMVRWCRKKDPSSL